MRGRLPFSDGDTNETDIKARLQKPIGAMQAFRKLSDNAIKTLASYPSIL